MNVINVFRSLDFGGIEAHACIINEHNYHDFNHKFLAICQGGQAETKIIQSGGSVHVLQRKAKIPSIRAIISLYKYFKKEGPSVVHTRGAEANFHGLIAAKLARVPVIIGEEIGIPNHGLKTRLIFKQTYRLANKVIGVSDAVTNWLVESGEVSKEKAIKIYNPVVIPKPKDLKKKQDGRFLISFVGRLEPVKNPLALVEALSIVVKKGIDAELWIIGDGSQKESISDLAETLGISDRVKLMGFQDEPDKYVRQTNLYVQPSISEGFGLALVEAMGCAVPVIATSVGGAPEIINNNCTGWLIDKTDARSIADKITEVLTMSQEELNSIAIAGRNSVATRFEPNAYMKKLEALYKRELGKVQ